MPFDVSSGTENSLFATKMKDWDSNNKGYVKFKKVSKDLDSSKVPTNETKLSKNEKDISQATLENSNPPLATTIITSSRSTDLEKPIESQLLNLSDSNILKSSRTYGKKKEGISSVFCEKFNSDTEKSTKPSKHDNKYFSKTNYRQTYTDKSILSGLSNNIFENTNGQGDFQSKNDSPANGPSSDLKVGIFTDDIFSLYDSPNERECSSFNVDNLAPSLSNEVASNGYLRTRKNLKNHLVEQKRLDYDSEDDSSEAMKTNPGITVSKAKTSCETEVSQPPFLPNGSYKKPQKRKFCEVDSRVASAISKSPTASTEKMEKNSSAISINTASNSKKRLSMLDVVRMLSVKRQKQVSETSHEAFGVTSPSPKKGSFTILSPSENNNYVSKCNSPEYISSEKSNLKRDEGTKQTKNLSNFEATNLSSDKAKSKSSSEDGLLINKKSLCDSIRNKPETSPSAKKYSSPAENNSFISTCNSPKYISPKKSDLKSEKVTNRTKNLNNDETKSESTSLYGLDQINEKLSCDSISNHSHDSLGLVDDEINVNEEVKDSIKDACAISQRFASDSSVSEKHHPGTPLSRIIGKKRSVSCDGGLDIVKQPRINLTFDAVNRYYLARSNERMSTSPTKNSFMNGAPHETYINSKMTTVPEKNIPEQDSFIQTPDNSHICSRTKLLHVPIVVCDCGDSNSAKNSDSPVPSVTAQVNSFASTVVNIVKRNPENFQLLSYNHYKTFCDSIQRVFRQTNVENSCDLFDLHPSVTTTNHLSKTKPFKDDSKLDGKNNNQCQTFIESAFNFREQCIYKMVNSFIKNLDICELQFTVKHFCSSPKVVRFMSEFFSGCDRFSPTSVNERKIQFEFSKDYEKDPLCSVVKEYTHLFVHKIWPLGSQTLASQSVMKFAYKNMSTAEISIMSYFFHSNELLTLKAFVQRFTYVAVLAICKFYGRINEC